MSTSRRPGFASFKPFEGRHSVPTPTPPTAPSPQEHAAPATVARPLRLAPHVDEKLQQLARARGGLSLNAVVIILIAEEWSRVFRPSTEILVEQVSSLVGAAVAAFRSQPDTISIPNEGKRVARTLRLSREVDHKLGELAIHYGGLDRTSTIALVVASAWRRECRASDSITR